jgi:predicted GNAT superfamily acetyltransferase
VLGQNRDLGVPSPGELPADMPLRQLLPSDRERILTVVDRWWGRPMVGLLPPPFFVHFRDTSFVIEREGELVAFLIGFLSQANADEAYVHAIGVSPSERRSGLGRLLYQRFVDVAARCGRRRVCAITSPANAGSIAFHRELGFTVGTPTGDGPDARADLVLDLASPRATAGGAPKQAQGRSRAGGTRA